MTLSLRCYHCNEPVPAKGLWSAWVLGEDRPMCCAGCQAVAQAIVASGGESYYAQRTSTALEPKQLERLSVWADLLEDPAWTGRHIQTVTSSIQIPGQAQSNQDTDRGRQRSPLRACAVAPAPGLLKACSRRPRVLFTPAPTRPPRDFDCDGIRG